MDRTELALLLLSRLEEFGVDDETAEMIASSSFVARRSALALKEVAARSGLIALGLVGATSIREGVRALDQLSETEADTRYALSQDEYHRLVHGRILDDLMP